MLAIAAERSQGQETQPQKGQQAASSSLGSKPAALVKDPRSPAGQTTLGLVAGAPGSTEAAIGYELSTVLAKGQETGPNGEVALRVLPIVGRGGVQTIRDVLTLPGADMGIAPAIILDRVRQSKELGEIDRKLVYIAPLYTQELHVLAPRNITSLADLTGKSVNAGEDESTKAVARDIFDTLGLRVNWVSLDHAAALQRIRTGELAATILLTGKPATILRAQEQDPGLHMVPVDDERLLEKSYLPATLTHADYAELIEAGKEVDTVAVSSVLFAYSWPAGSARYNLLSIFTKALFSRIAEFQSEPRHPKWREINLAAVMSDWRRFSAAERWLEQARADTNRVTHAPLGRAVSETGSVTSPSELGELYREFLRWSDQKRPGARSP